MRKINDKDRATAEATPSSAAFIASSSKWIMIINIIQKLITFSLNQLLVAWSSPEIFGEVSIQLELLLSTLLFLSREGIRMSLLQYPVTTQYRRQSLINLSWFPSCLLLVVTLALCLVMGRSNKVVIMYATGALLESIGEPWYNVFQKSMHIGAKLQAETFAILLRCIISCYFIGYHSIGTLGFGVAQIVYGGVYLGVLIRYTFTCDITLPEDERGASDTNNYSSASGNTKKLTMSKFMPRRLGTFTLLGVPLPKFVDRSLLLDAFARVKSSVLKHVLTEADKICLTFGASAYNQGVYALTNNYGSLIARVIFLPLEDSSRLVFAQKSVELRKSFIGALQQATTTPSSIASAALHYEKDKQVMHSAQNDRTVETEKRKNMDRSMAISEELRELLYKLMRLTALVALFFPVLGTPYARLVVNTFFSAKWRSEETVSTLQYYCIYIAALALNGISEGFAYAVTPASSISKLNWNLVYSSCVFWLIGIPLVNRYGTPGLVLANTAGMLVRILLNVRFIDFLFFDPSGRNFLDEKEAIAYASSAPPLPPRKVNYGKLKEGHKVLAQYGGGDEWSKALVKRVRDDGTYDIVYNDDGTVELRVRKEHIDPLNTGDVGLWTALCPPLLVVLMVLLSVFVASTSALAYASLVDSNNSSGNAISGSDSPVPDAMSVVGLRGLLVKQVLQHLIIGVLLAIALLSGVIYFSPAEDVQQFKEALLGKAKLQSSSSGSSSKNSSSSGSSSSSGTKTKKE